VTDTPFHRVLLLGSVLAAALALAPHPASAQASPRESPAAAVPRGVGADGTATILFIDEIDVTRPTFQQAMGSFRDAINQRVAAPSVIRVESLGLHYAPSAHRAERLVDRIAEEYAQDPLDIIIAAGDSSVAVATRLRETWGRDIPIIGLFTASERLLAEAPFPPLPNGVQVRLGDFNTVTAGNIRALIPAVSEVLIVAGTDQAGEGAAAAMRPVLGDRVRVSVIIAPTFEELEERFAQLGSQSAIVYLSVGIDSRGRTWQVREYLRRLLELAPRPVFGWLGSYIGLGIVGGPVLDGSEIGDELGRLAAEVLNGADPGGLGPVVIEDARLVYDWVPMRRFGIPLRSLPDGATVLNRPLPIWESYPRTSIAVGSLILLLLVSIGILIYSRRRVREANEAQLALSRRLLQAQDEERVRIARDLHDDLCQEMAMLAIDMGGTRGVPPPAASVVDRVHGLIDRTRKIAVALHATHIGSLPFRDALASHAAGVQARTGLDIRVRSDQGEAEPSPPVAMALFRAVQEALQNTIRHADATEVNISVETLGDTIRIEVADDGIGFDPGVAANVGLGLTSMRERLAIIGGTFTVNSEPFGGTTVVLSAPVGAGAA
jgi:signal transduction histidine kinase